MSIDKFLEAVGLKRPPPTDVIFCFKKFYGFSQPYWEATAQFSPVGGAVEVLVECPRSGAVQAQHEFYRQLEARYHEALTAAHKAILRELSTASSGPAPPAAESLRLVCISLPTTPPSAEWELSFEDSARIHYDVAFQGWQPTRVEVTPC